jgi:aminoglycoside phosphotransferase (APT) family kinase protein
LTEFYKTQIGQATEININEFYKLSSGWETEIYSFDIDYQLRNNKRQENLILRTFPGTGGKETSRYEFEIMRNLAKNNYPVPKVLHLATEEEILGYPFIIMERLNGGTLSKAMRGASNAEKSHLRSLFVECFFRLHNLDWKAVVPDPSRYDFSNQFEDIKKSIESMKQDAIHYKIEEFLEVVEWLEERVDTISSERLSLVHYDYHPSNIVLSKEKQPFVIDWSVARVSDYRVDLGWTSLLQSTYGGYENRELILSEYQKLSSTKVENIEFFEVNAALRRLIVMAISLTGQDDVVETRSEVGQIMKGYTQHVDGVKRILNDRTGITLHMFDSMVRNAVPKSKL